MKKRKPWKTNTLIPNKEKEFVKLIKDPEAFKRMMELQKATNNLIEKQASVKATTLEDWKIRVVELLPDNVDKELFTKKLEELIKDFPINDTQSE